MRIFILIVLFKVIAYSLAAQGKVEFSRSDSLRGSLNPLRTAYDVHFYHLKLKIDPSDKTIAGSNDIHFQVMEDSDILQVDLFENLDIDSVIYEQQSLGFKREGNAFFIHFPETLKVGEKEKLRVYYHGKPQVAANAPWDGGFVWEKDKNGEDWVGVACEGLGASVWWPNKDHLSDEPDSMRMSFVVPENVVAVSNGQFLGKEEAETGFVQYDWRVTYPINNYNVTVNIADYAHFSDVYASEDGEELPLDYYVLAYNEEKAKIHFEQVKPMLRCFEELYGKYPFWNDGYALVETPYWGMEHQGAIAYGNNYVNNEFGFDFIIVHESGHEYWGNSVSSNDHGEMWIHETFTTYTDALFTECLHDYETSIAYLETQKPKISNKTKILGLLGVNYKDWEDSDMYYKGAWMLHSIRNTINNDERWFATLKALYQEFEISHVNTEDIISFMVKKSGYNVAPIFDHFLNYTVVPTLEYRIEEQENGKYNLVYRWTSPVKDFNMGMIIKTDKMPSPIIYPKTSWQNLPIKGDPETLEFAEDMFYFEAEEVK